MGCIVIFDEYICIGVVFKEKGKVFSVYVFVLIGVYIGCVCDIGGGGNGEFGLGWIIDCWRIIVVID